MAKEYALFLRTDVNKARALFTFQLNRKWGHTIARGWARLVVERFQEQTHDKSSTSILHRNAEIENIDEHYGFFNPSLPCQGSRLSLRGN